MMFYNQVLCRICELKIGDCQCHPMPCPFCDKEFGFSQDWNIHLIEVHKILGPEVKKAEPEFTARLIP